MKKVSFIVMIVALITAFGSCGGSKQQASEEADSTSVEELVPRDKTIYGICTDDYRQR